MESYAFLLTADRNRSDEDAPEPQLLKSLTSLPKTIVLLVLSKQRCMIAAQHSIGKAAG